MLVRNILAGVSVAVLTASLLGCSSHSQSKFIMPEVKQVEVACVQVEGLPEFKKETCEDLANRVRQGVEQFHHLTGGVVESPREVRPRVLPGTIKVKNALKKRCVNYTDEEPEQKGQLDRMIDTIARTAMEKVTIDPSQTALVIAVNASMNRCRKEKPPVFTDRCPDAEARWAAFGGVALHRETNKPIAFIFAALPPDGPEFDVSLTRHEWGHLGIGKEHLGHDHVLCNPDGDYLPTVIDASTKLRTNLRSWKASIMNYTHDAPDVFIAPPHLAQLGLIKEERIHIPEKSGTFILNDTPQAGPVALNGEHTAAALWLELNNPAIETAIKSEVSEAELSVDDYGLFVGRVVTLSDTAVAEVVIYAAPTTEQLRNSDNKAPIFLVQRLKVGEHMEIANGPSIRVVSGNKNVVKVDLQLAG